MIQRRAARYVTNRFHNTSSVTAMLNTLDWRPLIHRRMDARLCLFYKIVHGLVLIPKEPYCIPITGSSRLNHDNAFQVPYSNSYYHQNSFFPSTIRLWNSLPNGIVSQPTLETFKTQLTTINYKI